MDTITIIIQFLIALVAGILVVIFTKEYRYIKEQKDKYLVILFTCGFILVPSLYVYYLTRFTSMTIFELKLIIALLLLITLSTALISTYLTTLLAKHLTTIVQLNQKQVDFVGNGFENTGNSITKQLDNFDSLLKVVEQQNKEIDLLKRELSELKKRSNNK